LSAPNEPAKSWTKAEPSHCAVSLPLGSS